MRCILCNYMEYRCTNGKWGIFATAEYEVDYNFINNMVEASSYFTQLGGYMSISLDKRRFGDVVKKIVSVSICGSVKKVYNFKYV